MDEVTLEGAVKNTVSSSALNLTEPRVELHNQDDTRAKCSAPRVKRNAARYRAEIQ